MYLLEILKLAFIDLSAELKYFPASDCALNTNWRLSVKNEESNRNTRRGLIIIAYHRWVCCVPVCTDSVYRIDFQFYRLIIV